ncbi:MAG: hypothetical protein Q8L14_08825 [Myxococcales bacterium]|nr:hypothetical protein [Myxococcales bacterium]
MPTLPHDTRFLKRAIELVREAGLMREPRFDAESSTLIEGTMALDLLNVWHHSHQLNHPNTDAFVAEWLRPSTLATAAAFGRLDLVKAAIASGAPLVGPTAGGDPLQLAIGAFCFTRLHLELIRCLIAAGVPVTKAHFSTWKVESMGTPLDFELLALLEANSTVASPP